MPVYAGAEVGGLRKMVMIYKRKRVACKYHTIARSLTGITHVHFASKVLGSNMKLSYCEFVMDDTYIKSTIVHLFGIQVRC